MDNLSVHTSKLCRDKMVECNIPYIFNVPYSPDYNPIEFCFSKLKNNFKKLRMDMIVNNKKMDIDGII